MAETLNNLIVVRAVGAGVSTTYTMARAASLFDAVVIATNAGAGTVTLRNGLSDITDALDPASTNTAIVRPAKGGVFTSATKNLAVGDVLTFHVDAGTLNYESFAYLYPTPAVPE